MRGIEIKEYVKGPAELKVTDLPDPTPKADEYLIQVHAAAANFFDILQVQGKYQNQPPFPWVAGAEFAGTVISAPSKAGGGGNKFKPGARVFGASQGAYATRLCAKESVLLPVPDGWSFQEAAGLFVTAPTSYGALVVRAGVKQGDHVLVHAAAGGVGLAAVQVAKAFGATVIATASTQRKLDIARSFGADHVVSYNDAEWPAKVKALTPQKRGVDIVYDPVGLVDKSTKCTAWNGRILVVGFAAGSIEKVAMNKVLLKNISIVGIHWGAYAVHQRDMIPVVWRGIMDLVAQGKLKGTVYDDDEFVGLERVKDALVALGGRGTWGKVVVKIPQGGNSKL
ncbi:NADPH:quinone reductase [Purpureocillium takamizusanense]|uniref:NADPH:quinone reductase n=1 Tax=Purpureocillium takamizusanense TaxID=2060973 RepID=A0A9Q8QP87_9HYPO|nr:NADPH:quinone reductase [Purpureocillium takamizusanense]UNI23365.1 NADPH:quinone reductase [Purpureocillium takamizusanense]